MEKEVRKHENFIEKEWVQNYMQFIVLTAVIMLVLALFVYFIKSFIEYSINRKDDYWYFKNYCKIKNFEPRICKEAIDEENLFEDSNNKLKGLNSTLLSKQQMNDIKEFVENYIKQENEKIKFKRQELENKIQSYRIDE